MSRYMNPSLAEKNITAQKMKFFVNFLGKCDQICSLLTESLMKNIIFVQCIPSKLIIKIIDRYAECFPKFVQSSL